MGDAEILSTKQFQLRAIPADLHKKWRLVASMKEISMEQLAVEAITKHIAEFFREKHAEILAQTTANANAQVGTEKNHE